MVKDNIIPNHMDIYWHDYTGHVKDKPITEASVPVKAALIGRVGLMLLESQKFNERAFGTARRYLYRKHRAYDYRVHLF